jgi:hypothetical protein
MSPSTIEWTKVLTHPLGLTGYVLFLLFGFLSRVKRKGERRWILPITLAAAGVALLGGIGLAYWEVTHQERAAVGPSANTAVPEQQPKTENQTSTSGDNSPIVQGVQGGSVSINYSGAQTEQKRSPDKKPILKKPVNR